MSDSGISPPGWRGCIASALGPPGEVANLVRLTGGATKATWSFDARVGDETVPLVLQQAVRKRPPGDPMNRAAARGRRGGRRPDGRGAAGVPVPRVRLVLAPTTTGSAPGT